MAKDPPEQSSKDDMAFALEEITKSRDRYAFLFEHAPVGYFIFNNEGKILAVNVTGAELLRTDHDSLLEHSFADFIVADDRSNFEYFIRNVFSSKHKKTCRLELLKARPQPFYVRIEGLATADGQECLAVLVDITEKKRAVKALSESEYNLAKSQSMTNVGSWSYDPQTGEVQASAELLRIMRLSSDQVNRDMFASVVHPDDYSRVIGQMRRGAECGRSYAIEHRLLFNDGTLRWVYTIVEPSFNLSGKVLRLYGTTQDITLRKQVEVELRNKTNELQAIFDSIGDGIIVYDHDGRVQHHNLISPQLFPRKVFTGAPRQAIFHNEVLQNVAQCPVAMALKGQRTDMSMSVTRSGQPPLYVDVTATPIKDALGEKNRALLFLRDVSQKRLQEIHLIQTEKMSSIGVLATGIAHEINNPLTSVAGCAEALLRRLKDASALASDPMQEIFSHYLDIIVRESYRCKGITDHLLSFGCKTTGVATKVDVNIALVEIIELIKYQPRYSKIKVISNFSPFLPRVKGDPSGLRQVFMNLLVNAHQAIEGDGVIDVATEKYDDDTVSIAIRDSGCGMEENIIERIWEPFFTTKEVGTGTGLGLAITYNIIKEHGGEIRLVSRVGEGSEFTVLLPVWQG
jgi:PAS domain S-box-containing protein